MFTNIQRLLADKSQDVLIRQRTSFLCSFTLDTLYLSLESPEKRENALDFLLNTLVQ